MRASLRRALDELYSKMEAAFPGAVVGANEDLGGLARPIRASVQVQARGRIVDILQVRHGEDNEMVSNVVVPLSGLPPVWLWVMYKTMYWPGAPRELSPLELAPDFDAEYKVRGYPRELVSEIFDEPIRRVLLQAVPPKCFIKVVDHNKLLLHMGGWFVSKSPVWQIHQVVDGMAYLAWRLEAVWQARIDAARQRGGEQAARELERSTRADLSALQGKVDKGSRARAGCLIGCVALFILSAFAFMFAVVAGLDPWAWFARLLGE